MDSTPPSNGDVFQMHLNTALQYINLAKSCEQSDKYEAAYNHYFEASNKLMGLVKSETDENKKTVFMKHLNQCISQAMFLKELIKDKKKDLLKLQGNPIKPST